MIGRSNAVGGGSSASKIGRTNAVPSAGGGVVTVSFDNVDCDVVFNVGETVHIDSQNTQIEIMKESVFCLINASADFGESLDCTGELTELSPYNSGQDTYTLQATGNGTVFKSGIS